MAVCDSIWLTPVNSQRPRLAEVREQIRLARARKSNSPKRLPIFLPTLYRNRRRSADTTSLLAT